MKYRHLLFIYVVELGI